MRSFSTPIQWVFVAVLSLIAVLLTGCPRGGTKAGDQSLQPVVPNDLTLDLSGGVTMRLVLIPAGTFTMGSPDNEKDRNDDEGPQRLVTITRPFYMGVHEVTQAQWKAVMGTEPWKDKAYTQDSPCNAACHITWDDATEFCRRLSRRTGRTVRLPTEAEWEYACRAESTTRFYYGDDLDYADLWKYAWYDKNSWDLGNKFAHPVGCWRPNDWARDDTPYGDSFKQAKDCIRTPNVMGLYDMHGNVWEWCSDWYQESYSGLANTDPTGPPCGAIRVQRGGSIDSYEMQCRSAQRNGNSQDVGWSNLGMRVVVEAVVK